MNKSRVEAFSDGVFSIVMTLLILELRIPAGNATITDLQLWHELAALWPIISIYVVTFTVLSVLWINHHFIFHSFAKSVDRWLNLLNLLYLMFIVFVPFAAHLLGNFPHNTPAAVIYGSTIFVIVLIARLMIAYIVRKADVLNEHISGRLINQARFRSNISLVSYMIGIVASSFSLPVGIFFFVFPVIFNIVPGTLDLAERIFKFSLD
jgi:uncharacterized membrane protein